MQGQAAVPGCVLSPGVYPGADLQRQRRAGEAAAPADDGGEGLARAGDPPADRQWEGNHHHPGSSLWQQQSVIPCCSPHWPLSCEKSLEAEQQHSPQACPKNVLSIAGLWFMGL